MEEGCKRLWAAVLKQAIKDIRGNNYHRREKAQSWLINNNQGTASFLWICNILGLDPDLIRMNLTTPTPSDADAIAMQFRSKASYLLVK